MQVKSLKLRNFRNYASASFTFHPSLNVITGNNGIGKTNILESILLTSNTKSFRTSDDKDMIRDGTEYARVEIDSDSGRFKVVLNKAGKTLFLNDLPVKKTSDFIGKLNAVLFKPNDLELFTQSPRERRKILDIEIGKISRTYLDALLRYNLLLKDKNRLLKEEKIDEIYLSLIESSMVDPIQTIIEERTDFFCFINEKLSGIYQKISGSETQISVVYRQCCSFDSISESIRKNRERDFYLRYTAFGPHHEDYSFLMNGHDLDSVASQGQRRMVLIAFKFAIVDYIRAKSGKIPVVLLDDILSELDPYNRERLLQNLPEGSQTFLTDTDIRELKLLSGYKLIQLKEDVHG